MAFYRYERIKHPSESESPLSGFKKVVYYDYTEVDTAIASLTNSGYTCYQISEGNLGSGDWICEPPDDGHRYVVITEVAVNRQYSGHTVRFCKKLSKANAQRLREYLEGENVYD